MIKRLRIKFILIAMLSLFFVLTILVAAINIFSYKGIVERADETLEIILKHQGRIPQIQPKPTFPNIKDWEEFRENIPSETRFFSVIFSKNGDPVSVIMDNISISDKESAIRLAQLVLESGEEKGDFCLIFSKSRKFFSRMRINIVTNAKKMLAFQWEL